MRFAFAVGLIAIFPHHLPAAGERPGWVIGSRVVPSPSTLHATGTMTGLLKIATAGEYRFRTSEIPAGTATIRINGTAVADKPLALPVGFVPVEIVFELPNAIPITVAWSGPGFRWEPIPAAVCFHTETQLLNQAKRERNELERGLSLYVSLNCMACHGEAKRTAPPLNAIGERHTAAWLDDWLADPHKHRPQTDMPAMFANDDRGQAERYAVTMALIGDSKFVDKPLKADAAAVRRGEKLYPTVGCAACHSNTPNEPTRKPTEDDDPAGPYDPLSSFVGMGSPTGPQSTYALGNVGKKWSAGALAEYLRDPAKFHPNGRMPSMALTDAESNDLALFLVGHAKPDTAALMKPTMKPGDLVDAKLVAGLGDKPEVEQWKLAGSALLTAKGCMNCHERPEPPLRQRKRLVDGNGSCISDSPDRSIVPDFRLTKADGQALRKLHDAGVTKVISHVVTDLAPLAAPWSLSRLMCLNCHERNGEGGLSAKMADRMTQFATAENADDVRPPTLTDIGQKATHQWLTEVLHGNARSRPWLGLRMPTYGKAALGRLDDDLPPLDGVAVSRVVASPAKLDPTLIAVGRTLTGKDGYGCITCHDIAGIAGGGTHGPDLSLTTKRIRDDWFDRWMENPQRIQPGTKMPQYFLNGKGTHPALGADPAKQIAALKAYFDLGPTLPLPTGLEPPKGLTIVVRAKPELVRTFLPDGAGTRSIAVGYPGGVNIAYDATHAKLAYVWSGPFLDMAPVWANRGGRPAKLLGPMQWKNEATHDWTTTVDAKTGPDFTSTEPPRFLGYSQDAAGMPTFRSSTAGAEIAETITPLASGIGVGIARTFKVTVKSGPTVWLMPGVGAKTELKNDGYVVYRQADGKIGAIGLVDVNASPLDRTYWSRGIVGFPNGTTTVTLKTWFLPRDDASLLPPLK